jgi:hypothetical protein
MVIDILLMAIDGYWWLLMVIVLVVINGYSIRLLVNILSWILVVINDYYINDYW